MKRLEQGLHDQCWDQPALTEKYYFPFLVLGNTWLIFFHFGYKTIPFVWRMKSKGVSCQMCHGTFLLSTEDKIRSMHITHLIYLYKPLKSLRKTWIRNAPNTLSTPRKGGAIEAIVLTFQLDLNLFTFLIVPNKVQLSPKENHIDLCIMLTFLASNIKHVL